jgi:hypothetical protein
MVMSTWLRLFRAESLALWNHTDSLVLTALRLCGFRGNSVEVRRYPQSQISSSPCNLAQWPGTPVLRVKGGERPLNFAETVKGPED